MLKRQILLICIVSCTHPSLCWITDILKMGKAVWKVAQRAPDMQSQMDVYQKVFEVLTGSDETIMEMNEKITQLTTNMKKLEHAMNQRFDALQEILSNIPNAIALNEHLKDYRIFLAPINDQYDELMRHMKSSYKNSIVWRDFAKTAITTVKINIGSLESVLAPKGKKLLTDKGLVELIAEHGMKSGDESCKSMGTQSYQFILHDLLNVILLTEMKVLHILSACYRIEYEEDWQRLSADAVEAFEGRYINYLVTFLKLMGKVGSTTRACVPSKPWVKGVTYHEVSSFREIFYKVLYSGPPQHCYQLNPACRPQDCLQALDLQTCKKDDKYLWIQLSGHGPNIGRYGSPENCPVPAVRNPRSGWASMPRTCFCNCFTRDSIHRVSLEVSKVDIDNNKVVTGAKIVLQDKVFHIQVQQGKLMANGEIDEDTLGWVSLPTDPETVQLTRTFRSFFLSNLILPEGYLLIGLQFGTYHDKFVQAKNGVYLGVLGRKYDSATGSFLPGNLHLRLESASNYIFPSYDLHSPIHATNPKYIGDSDDYVVLLDGSYFDHDVGQVTLPLIDALPVTPSPPTPLSGFGFYHRKVQYTSGFISLQAHSLPYQNFVSNMLRKFKPGELFDKCNHPSCTPDNIFDLGERLYEFMEKVMKKVEFKQMKDVRESSEFREIIRRLAAAEYEMNDNKLRLLIANITSEPLGIIKIIHELDAAYVTLTKWIEAVGKNSNTAEGPLVGMREKLPHALKDLKSSIVSALLKLRENQGPVELCKGETMHHILTHIFQRILVADMKAMTVLIVQSQTSSGLKEEETALMKRDITRFKARFMAYIRLFANTMNTVMGEIRPCDWNENTVSRDEKPIEIDSLGDRVSFDYDKLVYPNINCATALAGKKHNWYEASDQCPTDPVNCYEVAEDYVCRANNSILWVKEGPINHRYGERNCAGEIRRYNNIARQHCICSCSKVNHYISLDLVQSNVDANMVVVGVQFVYIEHVLHIRIKQGRLLPNGWIDVDSQSWLPVNPYPETMQISSTQKTFFLDDLIFPSAFAVIGVKFAQQRGGVVLQVTAQKFNYPNGELVAQQITRTTKQLESVELAVRKKTVDDKRQANGTTTLPFINSLIVETNPPSVIGGIGIFHKVEKYNIGYISLKLYALQFKKNLQDFLQKDKEAKAFVVL